MPDQFVEYTQILWDRYLRGKYDEERYAAVEWEAEAQRKETEGAA